MRQSSQDGDDCRKVNVHQHPIFVHFGLLTYNCICYAVRNEPIWSTGKRLQIWDYRKSALLVNGYAGRVEKDQDSLVSFQSGRK